MTREEALQAMINGEKVTHRYFTSDEYIYMKGGNIFSEEGYNFGLGNKFQLLIMIGKYINHRYENI